MSEKKKNLKCSYKNPCHGMASYASANESSGNAKGLFSLENMMNIKTGTMYHVGFFIRGSRTPKNGIMLNFCPFCGVDLDKEWYAKARAEHDAAIAKYDQKNPSHDEKWARAKKLFKKEQRAYYESLDPSVKKTLKKLSEPQRLALLESYTSEGKFLHGAPGVSWSTLESLEREDRGLMEKGRRRLNKFGLQVREAARGVPQGYSLNILDRYDENDNLIPASKRKTTKSRKKKVAAS